MNRFLLSLLFLSATFARADWRRDWVNEQVNLCDVREVAATGSMKPMFDENDLILVQDRPFHSLKVGDVIVYRARGREDKWELIVHKIVRISSGGSVLVCKGIANWEEDSQLVMEADYVGRVVGWVARD